MSIKINKEKWGFFFEVSSSVLRSGPGGDRLGLTWSVYWGWRRVEFSLIWKTCASWLLMRLELLRNQPEVIAPHGRLTLIALTVAKLTFSLDIDLEKKLNTKG